MLKSEVLVVPIIARYFEWLSNIVCRQNRSFKKQYESLLLTLYSREFHWTLSKDANRASDGEDLRQRFVDETPYDELTIRMYINKPCSVLEMMIALSIRMNATIEGDEDETERWFWEMIFNMDLMGMTETDFDREFTESRIDILLDRSYSRDGSGGLFYVPNPRKDMRKTELWYQMVYYLDTIYDPNINW